MDSSQPSSQENFALQSLLEISCFAAAIAAGLYAAHVDHHNHTEVYPTLFVVLVSSFALGVVRPGHAWRWALIIGLLVPFAGPLQTLFDRLSSPGSWAILAVVLIPGLIGAYTGWFLRRAISRPI